MDRLKPCLALALVLEFCISPTLICEGKTAEDSLSKTRVALFQEKCKSEASEYITSTVNNVSGILRLDEHERGRPFVGGITMHFGPFGGESNTHPHYMFGQLGLDFLEYEQQPEDQEKTNKRFARVSYPVLGKPEPIDKPQSRYGIRFKSIASSEEERIGIRGRQIEVFEIVSGKVLAVRKEFFARHPDFSRSAGTGLCPPLKPGQGTPDSFLSRVINPISYGCWHRTEQYATLRDQDIRINRIRECEAEYRRSGKAVIPMEKEKLPGTVSADGR